MAKGDRWSDEMTDKVVKLWRGGMSAQTIADRLGDGHTRNGVIGRLSRIGELENVRPGATVDSNALKQRIEARARREGRQRPFVPQPTKSLPDPETPVTGPVIPLMALQSHSCRWPIGDPSRETFGFCGVRKDVGGSYCVAHARQAVQVQHGDKRFMRLARIA